MPRKEKSKGQEKPKVDKRVENIDEVVKAIRKHKRDALLNFSSYLLGMMNATQISEVLEYIRSSDDDQDDEPEKEELSDDEDFMFGDFD